jgi:hypothetical protein
MENKIFFVLIGLIICGVLGGYYIGNNQGYQTGYSKGYFLGYNSGYSEGNNTGYKTGYSNGSKDGYNQGYSVGYTSGDTAGYNRGYSIGYNTGNTNGYSTGYSTGKTEGYKLGNSTGYTLGFTEGYSTTGYDIRDPTYAEMLNFISADRTNYNQYVDSSYVCHDFSSDVDRNAYKVGYRCYWAFIEFGETNVSAGHTAVAFNTTDRGIIFIEPQSDRIINVRVGQPYWDRSYYQVPSYDDTVTKITLMP